MQEQKSINILEMIKLNKNNAINFKSEAEQLSKTYRNFIKKVMI